MPQDRKWYQLSIRDSFLVGGLMTGWAAHELIQAHIHPRPYFLEFLPIATAVLGAAIAELVTSCSLGDIA